MNIGKDVNNTIKLLVPSHIPNQQVIKYLDKENEKVDIERGLIEDGLHEQDKHV